LASQAILRLAGGLPEPRSFSLRRLKDHAGLLLDEAVTVWLPGPLTVTGEDMAEFHVHGSPAVIATVLRTLGWIDGLVMAEAGEFTRRAFVNGRMDLVEVEGLGDLLAADSEAQRRLAMRQFTGEVSSVYQGWRDGLISILAMVEASIDFVEEEGVADAARAQVVPLVDSLVKQLQEALGQSERAGLVRSGLKLVIAGPPNAGKSSLVNWLARREAAIVSPIAGTTRDVIEARVILQGVPVIVTDTAGLRGMTSDSIEAIGMARAHNEVRDADVVIWVTAVDSEDDAENFIHFIRRPDLHVFNKSDLIAEDSIQVRNEDSLLVSVKTGEGLDDLLQRIEAILKDRSGMAEHAVVVRERHRIAIQESIRILNDLGKPNEMPLELMAEALRRAAFILGSVTGRVDVEDLLDKIFSEFCIGK
jgi:tRNA modification GTPase